MQKAIRQRLIDNLENEIIFNEKLQTPMEDHTFLKKWFRSSMRAKQNIIRALELKDLNKIDIFEDDKLLKLTDLPYPIFSEIAEYYIHAMDTKF